VKRFFKTRYVALLEEENARLKAENLALRNSLLEVLRCAAVDAQEPVKPAELRVAEKMAQGPLVETVVENGQVTQRIKDRTSYAIQVKKVEAEERRKQHSFRPRRRYR